MNQKHAHTRRRAEITRQRLLAAGLSPERVWGTRIQHLGILHQIEDPQRTLDAWWMARTLADLRGYQAALRDDEVRIAVGAAMRNHFSGQRAS